MKNLFLSLFGLSIVFNAMSQDTEDTKVDFGIKGGVNIAGISGDYAREINANYKVSLHGGIFFSYPIITDKFNIQGELLFSGKGYKADVVDSVFDFNITHNQFYWDIPIFAQIFFSDAWEVHIGGQYSILLFEQYVNFVSDRKSQMTVSNSDYGLLVGGAYHLDERNKVGFRYVYGLKDIIEYQGKKGHTSLFQIYISYTIF